MELNPTPNSISAGFWGEFHLDECKPLLIGAQYHQRLFVLDTQVKHIDEQSLHRLGHWLRRKWYQCLERQSAAEQDLEASGLTSEELQAEWGKQVETQTKPIPSMCHVCFLLHCIHLAAREGTQSSLQGG